MKELTAVFMDVLGKKTGQEDRAAALVRDSMLLELSERTRELSSSGTLFFSREGRALKQDLEILRRKAENLAQAYQAAGMCAMLRSIFIRAEKLHREAQREIHRPGHIRASRLHFFYAQEQEEALEILEEFIKAELYRILALGGGRMFFACRPLRGYPRTLQGRMEYLNQEILPVTDSPEFRDRIRTRYWAVEHRDEMKAGAIGVLPGFRIADPVKADSRFMAGEHRLLPYRGTVVLQGVGYLTNVRPDTVEEAQRQGALKTEVTPSDLAPWAADLKDPDAVLSRVFEGSLYAVSPSMYFGVSSYVAASGAVDRRRRLGQCLLCGQSAEGENFCVRCARKIKIV